jgi:hypothetical protein
MTQADQARLIRDREALLSAVRVIHTWAAFRGGLYLDAGDVAELCRKTLERTRRSHGLTCDTVTPSITRHDEE